MVAIKSGAIRPLCGIGLETLLILLNRFPFSVDALTFVYPSRFKPAEGNPPAWHGRQLLVIIILTLAL